jgi:hypothetical protein
MQLVDAMTGNTETLFNSLVDNLITVMVLDGRERKIVLGTTDGQLSVVNCLNGATVKVASALLVLVLTQMLMSLSLSLSSESRVPCVGTDAPRQ